MLRQETTAHKSNLNKLDFIKGKVTLAFVFESLMTIIIMYVHNAERHMPQNSCGAMDSLVELVLSSYLHMGIQNQTQVSLPVRQAP